MQSDEQNLKRRFLTRMTLLIAAVILLGSGMVIRHGWQLEQAALDAQASTWSSELHMDLDHALAREADGMLQALQVIGVQSGLRKALAQRDVTRLQAEWMGVFRQLCADHQVTHFYFIGLDRTALLRLHLPDQRGDRIDRLTLLEAERTGKAAWGLEMGSAGLLTLRVVQPVFDAGRRVGYVELGKEIGPLLAMLHMSDERRYMYAVLLDKEKIDRVRWEAGMRLMGRPADWESLPRHVLVYRDPKLDLAVLKGAISRPAGHSDYVRTASAGRIIQLQADPLQVAGGEEVGTLLVYYDVTDNVDLIERRTAVQALVTLSVAALLLLFFVWAVKRLFRQIEEQKVRLIDSEARFHTLFDSSPDPVWIMEGHRVVECNQAAVEMLGFPDKTAFEQMHLADISPERQPDGESSFDQAERMIKLAHEKGLHRFEWVHRRRDGSDFDAEVTLSEMSLQGRPVLHVVVRDVSERKQTENALRRSKEELRTILDGVEAAIYLKDANGNYLFANAAVRRLWQVEMEDIIGHGDERFFDAQTAATIRRNDHKVLVDGMTLRTEETNTVTATGLTFTYWSVKLPLRAEDGSIYALCGISTDISEHKRIEARLRKSEQDLKAAQRIARVGSWDLDVPSGVLHWSDEIYRIFEIDPVRFGASYAAFLDAIHPDDREAVNSAYTESLRTRQPYSIRHRLRMADGRIKHVHEECHTDFDETGAPLRSVGTVQDVTAQVQAEIALNDAGNLLQAVIDHVPMRIFWKDRALNYLGCNPAFARDAGLDHPGELIGKDDYRMGWASEAELYRADDLKVLESGVPRINYEEHQTTPDGEIIWLRTSKVPLRDQRGEIIGVLGIYDDVTDARRKDEELARYRDHLEQVVAERSAQLSEAQIKFQRLVEDMGDEFLVFSFTPGNVVTYVSNGFEAIFGLSKDRILGQPWDRAIRWVEEDLDETVGAIQDLLDGKVDLIRAEMRFTHPDGRLRTIYQTSHAVSNAAGEIVFVEGVLTDITHRKRSETELLQAKRTAEAASQAKSAFLANMSHEIRTPMNGVIGMLEILSRSALPGDERKMVETIRRSARSLLGIIDDILDFSKIEAGKLNLAEQEMSLEAELEIVVGLIDRLAMDRQVDLTMFFEPELPLRVIGDGLRLRQILTNLTGNAVKFSGGMERIGRVHLRAEPERCGDGRVWVAFTIADNGIGMDAETVARLFQPFEQADGTTTRKFGGTGLGLSISQDLTALMGGEITVRSEPGRGASFTVRLPFNLASACPNPDSPHDLSGVECVVVADDARYADDYTRYLVHAGARMHAFANLERAWEDFVGAFAPGTPVCIVVMEDPGRHSARETIDKLLEKHPDVDVHFVEVSYLSAERGRRRKVRRLSENVVQIDREALTRRRFLEATAAAVGRVAIVPEEEDAPPIDSRVGARLNILVAEDNEINRDVIARQLEILGHHADLAIDGERAFRMWGDAHYDLVLTDLHMPTRDGYELAALIRETEHRRDLDRTPIIALTANAMKGEEAHCLEVGMDAYLSKPIELARLKSVLNQWQPTTGASGTAGAAESETPTPDKEIGELALFDPNALTRLVGNKPATHDRLLRHFLASLEERRMALLQARDRQDLVAIGQFAHSLKSAARAAGAMQLGELCDRLERAGGAGDAQAAEALLPQFETNCQAVVQAVDARLGRAGQTGDDVAVEGSKADAQQPLQ